MCARIHQPTPTKSDIRSIYLKYDKTRKGYFDINDLKRVSKELQEEANEDTLNEMIKSIDSNLDGKVSFDDFYNVMTKKVY